jgi:hypothetical protein
VQRGSQTLEYDSESRLVCARSGSGCDVAFGYDVDGERILEVDGAGTRILFRGCRLLSVARSTLRYESILAQRDAPVIGAMRELAAQYRRFGYRRIRVFLERRGMRMSADRAHRIWRRARLQVPRRRPRRRIATGRPRPLAVRARRSLANVA